MSLPSDELIASLRHDLLAWFDAEQRDLPWRHSRDPYAIWISEIMLQQTQVVTVKDYYTRWMARFPDVTSLASAPLDDVLKLWAGLGYYSRARSLHTAANQVVDTLDGALPDTPEALAKLPGIGPYTAGAIASIAFDRPAPLVDGNVERVFARLFAIEGDPKTRDNQKAFWKIAAQLVDPQRPGDFNQALMELGATRCTPKSPACLLCPVRTCCAAFALGEPTRFPATVKRAKPKPVQVDSLVLTFGPPDVPPRYLLVRRPESGLLGNMLEVPTSAPLPREKTYDQERATLALDEVLAAHQLSLEPEQLASRRVIGHVDHTFSHLKMRFFVSHLHLRSLPDSLTAAIAAQAQRPTAARSLLLLDEEELAAAEIPKAQRKVLALTRE